MPQPSEFEAIYRAHQRGVYGLCLSLLRDPAGAEDVANETFVRAYNAWARRPPADDAVRPWLFRIARNAAIDELRRRKRRMLFFARMAPPAPAPDPTLAYEVRAEFARILDAMQALSARDRTLIGLRYGAEMTQADIAEVLGIREHAVATATQRALKRLRAVLARNA